MYRGRESGARAVGINEPSIVNARQGSHMAPEVFAYEMQIVRSIASVRASLALVLALGCSLERALEVIKKPSLRQSVRRVLQQAMEEWALALSNG